MGILNNFTAQQRATVLAHLHLSGAALDRALKRAAIKPRAPIVRAIAAIHAARKTRRENRAMWANWRCNALHYAISQANPSRLANRAQYVREQRALALFAETYRTNNDTRLSFGGEAPCAESRVYYTRNGNYPCKNTWLRVRLPVNWSRNVWDHPQWRTVDGLLTISLGDIVTIDGAQVALASWFEQSRGLNCNVITGYIAQKDGFAYHALTQKNALSGLARKIKAGEIAAKLPAGFSRYADKLDRVVSWDYARQFACESGLRNWLYRIGKPDAKQLTIGEILTAYKRVPAREVRLVLASVARG